MEVKTLLDLFTTNIEVQFVLVVFLLPSADVRIMMEKLNLNSQFSIFVADLVIVY